MIMQTSSLWIEVPGESDSYESQPLEPLLVYIQFSPAVVQKSFVYVFVKSLSPKFVRYTAS